MQVLPFRWFSCFRFRCLRWKWVLDFRWFVWGILCEAFHFQVFCNCKKRVELFSWYIKFKTDTMSTYLTPFMYSKGCSWRFLLKTDLKKGLHADRITLWAWIWSSSHTRVTSKKSLSSLSSLNAVLMFDSKSFHLKQNFSELPILPCAKVLCMKSNIFSAKD